MHCKPQNTSYVVIPDMNKIGLSAKGNIKISVRVHTLLDILIKLFILNRMNKKTSK